MTRDEEIALLQLVSAWPLMMSVYEMGLRHGRIREAAGRDPNRDRPGSLETDGADWTDDSPVDSDT